MAAWQHFAGKSPNLACYASGDDTSLLTRRFLTSENANKPKGWQSKTCRLTAQPSLIGVFRTFKLIGKVTVWIGNECPIRGCGSVFLFVVSKLDSLLDDSLQNH